MKDKTHIDILTFRLGSEKLALPAELLREILEMKDHNLVAWNCLDLTEPVYDTIVMNPPFEKFQDIDHVRHAFDLLKPGGRVVAISASAPWVIDALGLRNVIVEAIPQPEERLKEVREDSLGLTLRDVEIALSLYAEIILLIGMGGILLRRNALVMFMSVELMLNALNLTFVAAARELGVLDGQIAVFFVMVVAAAEVVVGLAIIVSIFRLRQTASVDELSELRG